MKNIGKKILSYALPLLVLAFTLGSCNDDDEVVPALNLDKTLSEKSDLSMFNAAIKLAKLTDFTEGGGPFTIFAPSNAAFAAAGVTTEAQLSAMPTNTLVNILTYHMQRISRTFVEIPKGPAGPMTQVNGLLTYATRNPTTNVVYINGAKITQSDIKTSNGIIHVIDKLLTPPIADRVTTLAANADFKLLVQGINKTALAATFNGANTLFAPNNAAMVAAGYDSTTIANLAAGAATTTFSNFLRYHLVPGRIFSGDFKDGALKTVFGTNITFSSGGTKVAGVNNATPLSFTFTDFLTSSGPIHGISGALRP